MRNDEALNWLTNKWNSMGAGNEAFSVYYKAMEAIAFRIPKPPVESNSMVQCPICHRNLTTRGCVKRMYNYCPKCGKAIDWRSYE